MSETKECSECATTKKITEFYWRPDEHRWSGKCRACLNGYSRRRRLMIKAAGVKRSGAPMKMTEEQWRAEIGPLAMRALAGFTVPGADSSSRSWPDECGGSGEESGWSYAGGAPPPPSLSMGS